MVKKIVENNESQQSMQGKKQVGNENNKKTFSTLSSSNPVYDRFQKIAKKVNDGEYVYVHKYDSQITIQEIVDKYDSINEFNGENVVQSTGRIVAIRDQSKFFFVDVKQLHSKVQLVIIKNQENTENLKVAEDIFRGDIIGFNGVMMRMKTGQLTVKISSIKILTPCLRIIPTDYYGIKDPETIYRRRYIDLLLNESSRKRFITRSKIISFLRKYLDGKGFIEVETPILDLTVGGATAKPFISYHNELKTELFMRVSPELYHKKLIVGGLEKVYEIGRVFRNEGVDLTHNPEFTICEFYWAYADYNDLIDVTEDFLNKMVNHLFKTDKVTYTSQKKGETAKSIELNFARPFKKIDMLDELSKFIGFTLTGENCDESIMKLIEICEKENIIVEEPKTTARVLDKLVGHFIEPQCINPTFIMNHPLVMSPLAKTHRSKPGITERFELFINGKEICNSYTELNNPFDQRERFLYQEKQKNMGDDEAMEMDEGFIEALEYGLPPTAGWGIGIDRLVMFMTNASNIRDVILFPTMKPEEKKLI